MGTKAGIFQIDDFSGGLVTKSSLLKLQPKQTPKCMNVWANAFGTLHRRYGYNRMCSTSAHTGGVCRGLFTLIKSASSKFLMAKFDEKLFYMDNAGGVWDGTWHEITLGSSLTTDSNMFWDVFKKAGVGTLLFTDDSGTDLMQSWAGTGNTAIIAGAPKCKQLKVWMNHVWSINCEAFYLLDACDTPWDANTLLVSDCETAWTSADSTNVTASTDVTDFKVGTAAGKITIGAGFTTGVAAYVALASSNYSTYAYVSMWIKSSVNTSSGDLHLLMDDTAACATPIETIDLPALTANTWTLVQVALGAAGSDTAIISVGLGVGVDIGAMTVWLDDIRVQKSSLQNLPGSADHGDFKVGTTATGASVIVEVASGHTTGLIASKNITQIDLSTYSKVDFWIKSSVALASGDLKLLLDDSIDCSSTTTKEAIDVPAMATPSTWTYCSISLANPTSDIAIRSVGLKVVVDKGAQTIHVDNVRATFTEPDRVTRSAILYYDDWNGTDSGWDDIFTAQDIGLTGIQDLKGSLYIFKRKSMHRITYLGGRPLIRIEQVKATIGSISPRTIIPVDVPGEGEYLIFLGADRQLYLFDGYNSKPISEPIQSDNGESTVYMNNISCASGLDAALALCHAVNIPDMHWYILFCPQGGSATVPTHAIVYDYLAKSFWTFDTQPFTAGWYGDDGAGSDASMVGGLDYTWWWNDDNYDDGAVPTAYGDGTGFVLVTSANHGLSNGNTVIISGTTSSVYDGTFTVSSVSTDTFKINATWSVNPSAKGKWYRTITTDWESPKLSPSKQGRPMLKKCRYVEGNSRINGTAQLTFSYRNDWATSYVATQVVIQSVNEWTRDVSQVENLIQVKIGDSSTSAPWELYSLDFVGEELTIGR